MGFMCQALDHSAGFLLASAILRSFEQDMLDVRVVRTSLLGMASFVIERPQFNEITPAQRETLPRTLADVALTQDDDYQHFENSEFGPMSVLKESFSLFDSTNGKQTTFSFS